MTPVRAEKLLQGQSGQARKVFAVVPIQQAWSTHQIKQELDRQGTPMELNILSGCLRTLVDAGLIGETQSGWFRSRVKVPAPAVEQAPPAAPPVAPHAAETPKVLKLAEAPQRNTLDILASLASELGDIADNLRQRTARVTRIAKDLEDLALSIEQEREASQARMKKAEQLQSLIRELTQEA